MKYRCDKSKEEIIKAIVDRFNVINKNLSYEWNDKNYGEYKAMIDLLGEIKIYEEEE